MEAVAVEQAGNVAAYDRQRAALLARVTRRYALQVRTVEVAELRLSIYAVQDPDAVMLDMERGIHQAGGVEDPRWQPYWAAAWASGLLLAQSLATRSLAGYHVLDLGCGLGVAGTVAAARGANVLMADAAHAALLFARLNSWPWRERVQTRQIDWCRDRLARRFQLILGADILYDRHDWPHLDAFWRHHLNADGQVLLTEPGRWISEGFRPWIEQHGWQVDATAQTLPGEPRPLWLLRLRRLAER